MVENSEPTHIAYAKKHVSKKLFVWLEIGRGRLDEKGVFHGMLDRLPIGGFNGYTCFVPVGAPPPAAEPERPEKANDEPADF
jgi:hypothetical protein